MRCQEIVRYKILNEKTFRVRGSRLVVKQKGFTLIELLVVVAIIGILAAVGVVAYNGYTASAKRNATLQQHAQAVKFINNTLKLCDVQGGGNVNLSSSRSINCNITNNASGINSLNAVFIGYFLDKVIKILTIVQ